MSIYDGLTIDNCNFIKEKALTKKDGVYTIRGIIYRVYDKRVTHYAYWNEIFLNVGFAITKVGEYTTKDEVKKKLKQLEG